MESLSRRGYEFTLEQKIEARQRADGMCEFPADPCPKKNNNHVGHLTGIAVGKYMGVSQETITSIENTIVQCWEHDQALDRQQEQILIDRTKIGIELYEGDI